MWPHNHELLPQATSSNPRNIHLVLITLVLYLQTMAQMVLGRQLLQMSQYVSLFLKAHNFWTTNLFVCLFFLAGSESLN